MRNKTKATAKDSSYYSQAVGRALKALERLKIAPEALSLQELASAIGGAKASVFRLLYTLEAHGYVARDATGAYSLSNDVKALIPRRFVAPLVRAARPAIDRLAQELGETASVAALFDNHIEVVAVAESPQVIRMSNTVGRIIQPHASSLGKAITAFQTEARREHLLHSYGIYRYTPKTITDRLALRAEFEGIRERGYAVEREETHLQGCCFGAPLLGDDGSAFAALSLAMPVMRLRDEKQQAHMIERLRTAAQDVVEALRSAPR
ncbi:MAG: IclR family transcriptional regulator [Bryobacterales bacterium]